MEDDRLPNQILYEKLASGLRKVGGQKKRYKDHVKTVLTKFETPPDMLETYAADRSDWRAKCHEGAKMRTEAKRTHASS